MNYILLFLISCCLVKPAGWLETSAEWIELDQNHWFHQKTGKFPSSGWEVDGNNLTLEGGKGGTLISKDKYGNFEWTFDYKIAPGANSGVKYFVSNEYENSKGSWLGLEYQLIDDTGYKGNLKDDQKTAALYDLKPAAENKPLNPAGEWNQVRIVVRGDQIQHYLNGKMVMEIDRSSADFKARVKKSKFEPYTLFGQIPEGHLMLQDHNGDITFRGLKVRKI